MTISLDGMQTNDPQQAENIVTRYPHGADVPVYYNPSNPSKACLEQKPLGPAMLRGVLILGTLAMPIIVVLARFFARQL